jgi:hypothetical protein
MLDSYGKGMDMEMHEISGLDLEKDSVVINNTGTLARGYVCKI